MAFLATDAMLTRQAAAQADDGVDQGGAAGERPRNFLVTAIVHHDVDMQIAVSGVTEGDNGQMVSLRQGFDGAHQLGQSPHRNHDILVDFQGRDALDRVR